MEWGNFRTPYLPRTFADKDVDQESVNPGEQVMKTLHIKNQYGGTMISYELEY